MQKSHRNLKDFDPENNKKSNECLFTVKYVSLDFIQNFYIFGVKKFSYIKKMLMNSHSQFCLCCL